MITNNWVKVKYIGAWDWYLNMWRWESYLFNEDNWFECEVSFKHFYEIMQSRHAKYIKLVWDPTIVDKKASVPTLMNLSDIGKVNEAVVEIKNEWKTKVVPVTEILDEITEINEIDEKALNEVSNKIIAVNKKTKNK